ncbi:hypothetical protein F5Y13DRAFT_51716 [Hypoxylon sp. FL1857]|nr:hypothetical protein F5Y13DRAFT_51716 [Hypoxylon sp. FL1857]
MEVLGTVAAAGQLIGTAMRILDSIAQLRDFLQHAPARYQGWHSELAVLHDTVSCIRYNSALQTSQITCIIEAMAPKIDTLAGLCLSHAPEPKQKLVRRLNKALTARAVESRILQSFQTLEHYKTTLILTISTLNVPFSITNPAQVMSEDERQNMRKASAGSSRVDLESLEEQDSLSLNHSDGSSSSTQSIQRFDMNQGANSDQTTAILHFLQNYMSSQPTHTTQGMHMQQSVFRNITLEGDGGLFGDTTGAGGRFEGIKVSGDGRVFGTHSGETATNWARSSHPFYHKDSGAPAKQSRQDTVIPEPMDGIQFSKAEKCSLSKDDDVSKAGLSEGDPDKMDIEKD